MAIEVPGLQEFLAENHRAILITRRSGDGLQMARVTAWADEHGYPMVCSRAYAAKVRNLDRDPRVALFSMSDEWFSAKSYQVEGIAEILRLPEIMPDLLEHFHWLHIHRGTVAPSDSEIEAQMVREQRILIRISPTRFVPPRVRPTSAH